MTAVKSVNAETCYFATYIRCEIKSFLRQLCTTKTVWDSNLKTKICTIIISWYADKRLLTIKIRSQSEFIKLRRNDNLPTLLTRVVGARTVTWA